MDHAIVIAAEVTHGSGALAEEPVTIARLRTLDGRERTVRILGGPTAGGGTARLAGYVVPIAGRRVRLDLQEEPGSQEEPASIAWTPAGPAWAPNTPAGTWPPDRLPLALVLALPGSRDLGADAAGEIEVAARTWGRPRCSGFRARFGGAKALVPGDDGESGVFFHDDAWPAELVPGAIAQTILHADASGRLRDADLHVNGAEYRFSTDGRPGTQDARGVLVHEIGHALGLGHSDDARATMHLSGSGLRWRSLEDDDVEGVCTLYPGTGADGCETDPCPAGFVCVGGACQRPGDRADLCSPCTPTAGACEAAGDAARCLEIGGGLACGRPCADDVDCGAGFSCRLVPEIGTRQCVSASGCAKGASPCETDAECTHPGARCRDGACLGLAADAGAGDAGADAATPAPRGGGSGCGCRSSGPAGARSAGALAMVALALALRRRSAR